MSNHNGSEILPHRKPKVSLAMSINQGLGGPKSRTERCAMMESRLISRPPSPFLKSDVVKAFERIIGFPRAGSNPGRLKC